MWRLIGVFALSRIWPAFRRQLHDELIHRLALERQLADLLKQVHKPQVSARSKRFWVTLRQFWSAWRTVLHVVQPETVISWHRQGFRWYWRFISRPNGSGRPALDREIRHIVRRIQRENPIWGAPRIHGELIHLGISVSQSTVRRMMKRRDPNPNLIRQWMTFLSNHSHEIASMDFFTIPTAGFKLLTGLVIVHHKRREILHVNVTQHPTADWTKQQLREAFPDDGRPTPRFMILDRDRKFEPPVSRFLNRCLGITPKLTSYRSPWQNGICERLIGSIRRDLLDHVIVFNEDHARRLLNEYVAYYHQDRTHLGLNKETPNRRSRDGPPDPTSISAHQLRAERRVGGLHLRYNWKHAA